MSTAIIIIVALISVANIAVLTATIAYKHQTAKLSAQWRNLNERVNACETSATIAERKAGTALNEVNDFRRFESGLVAKATNDEVSKALGLNRPAQDNDPNSKAVEKHNEKVKAQAKKQAQPKAETKTEKKTSKKSSEPKTDDRFTVGEDGKTVNFGTKCFTALKLSGIEAGAEYAKVAKGQYTLTFKTKKACKAWTDSQKKYFEEHNAK